MRAASVTNVALVASSPFLRTVLAPLRLERVGGAFMRNRCAAIGPVNAFAPRARPEWQTAVRMAVVHRNSTSVSAQNTAQSILGDAEPPHSSFFSGKSYGRLLVRTLTRR